MNKRNKFSKAALFMPACRQHVKAIRSINVLLQYSKVDRSADYLEYSHTLRKPRMENYTKKY